MYRQLVDQALSAVIAYNGIIMIIIAVYVYITNSIPFVLVLIYNTP